MLELIRAHRQHVLVASRALVPAVLHAVAPHGLGEALLKVHVEEGEPLEALVRCFDGRVMVPLVARGQRVVRR